MPRRSYSPSSRSRSSSAGPYYRHNRKDDRPGIKKTVLFVAAVTVAALCVHRLWPRGIIHSEKEHWERDHRPDHRRLRRRNVVRDRHNGYLDDVHPHDRRSISDRRRLPEREYFASTTIRGRRGSRYRDDESDADSYYSDDYLPSPTERTRFTDRRERVEVDSRGGRRRREIVAEGENVSVLNGPRDEVVRYEKTSTAARSPESSRFFEEDRRSRRRYEDTIDDWRRRGGQAFPHPSPTDERRETVVEERRSRRRYGDYDH